jgi:hypothetical protein
MHISPSLATNENHCIETRLGSRIKQNPVLVEQRGDAAPFH